MTVYGIDLSEHNKAFNLAQARAEGYEFVILRTNDGTYRDYKYQYWYEQCKQAGYGDAMAAYIFLRNPSEGASIAQQVQTALSVMGDNRLPMWLDMETKAGLTTAHALEAKRLFEQAGVYVPGFYTGMWWVNIFPNVDYSQLGAFWLSDYGANRVEPASTTYGRRGGDNSTVWNKQLSGVPLTLWQLGSNGATAGVYGHLDVNVHRGTLQDVIELFTGKETEMQFDRIEERYPSLVDGSVSMTPRETLWNVDKFTWETRQKVDQLEAKINLILAKLGDSDEA